jgi:Transposase domain (DUF772)
MPRGERSSRRIERLCADHVAYRVVCAQDAPDHSTLARFRAAHDQAFTEVFAQVLRLCAEAGMVSVGVISIDGTKIAANASKSANHSHDWVREHARQIAEDAVSEAAAVDAAEDAAEAAGTAGSGSGLPAGLGTRAARAAAINKAMEESNEKMPATTKMTPPMRLANRTICGAWKPVKLRPAHHRRGSIKSVSTKLALPANSGAWPPC